MATDPRPPHIPDDAVLIEGAFDPVAAAALALSGGALVANGVSARANIRAARAAERQASAAERAGAAQRTTIAPRDRT